jgi:hypothetical protein
MYIEFIEKKVWDNFVDESPYGLLFHKWDFLKTIEKYTDYKLVPYGIFKGRELFCIYPFFYKKYGILKMLYSPPQTTLTYVPYMGFVLNPIIDTFRQRKKENYMNEIIEVIENEIKRLAINYVSISMAPKFIDARPFKWNKYDIKVNYTYIIDLDRQIDEIWDSFSHNCKNNIKNSFKNNLNLKQENNIDLFYDIMNNGLQNERMTYFQRQNRNYLRDLLEKFPDNLKMYFVRENDEIIGNKLNIEYKHRVISWMGAVSLKRKSFANEFIHWELIKKAKREGFIEYENWGADVRRLNTFKSKFNPSLQLCLCIFKKDIIGSIGYWGYGALSSKPCLDFIRKKVK